MMPSTSARLIRDRSGVAAVEAALATALILVPLALGVIDLGLAFSDEARLDRALQAATFYVWSNPTGYTGSGIATAAGAGYGSGGPTLTVTPSGTVAPAPVCYCLTSGYIKGSSSVSCTSTCSSGAPGAYLTITASATFTLPVAVPYLASSFTQTVSGTIRTQ
jgi:Flp pilus assembly protein TadG